MKNMNFSYSSEPIMTINNKCKKGKINLNPKFQRGYVWKSEFKDELIYSILNMYPIGNVIISNNGDKEEVVDGQQRLKTIISFIDTSNSYSITSPKSISKIRVIISEYKEKYSNFLTENELVQYDKALSLKTIKFSDLPALIQDDFMSYNLNVTTLQSVDQKYTAEYFKFVQNQEKLKAGEIINSIYMYNDELNSFIGMINDKEKFITLLDFRIKRHEFDKHLINIVGVLNRKIPLNSESKKIVDFAKNFNSEMINLETKKLIANINLITTHCENEVSKIISGKTRTLKIILAFLAFHELHAQNIDLFFDAINHIESCHMNGNIWVTNKITFIEKQARSYSDILFSANKVKEFIEGKLDEAV